MEAHPKDALSTTEFRWQLARTIGIPFALLALLAGGLLWEGHRLLEAAFRVDHADRVIARIHRLERLFNDMESGVRGYLLTRNPAFRAPYDRGKERANVGFRDLEALLREDRGHAAEAIAGLRAVLHQWQESARAAVASREALPDLGEVGRRKMLMEDLRARTDQLRLRQESLRATREAAVSDRSRLIPQGALVLLTLAGAILYLVGRRHLSRLATSYDGRTRALEQSRRYLVTTLHSIADAVITTDLQGRVAELNPVAASLSGWTEVEARGRPAGEVLRMLNEETNEPIENPALEVLDGRSAATAARYALLLARDGTARPIAEHSAPICDDAGHLLGAVVVFRDMTEQRRRDQQHLAAHKLEAIGRLAGGVAHDFNNLLTVINGVSAMALAHVPGDHPLRTDLEDIWLAGERASALTRQLLAFGRRQVLAPQIIDLDLLVRDLERMLRRLIGENIDLAVNVSSAGVWVKADPSQVEQVILNLALNARDAMPNGGKLTIETTVVNLDAEYARLHPGVTPRNYALVAVSDTGTGMTLATQAHLFEPFFTTKERGQGTGLGLATVHGIVKQSGGHIWVYSTLGHGTVFKVYLPLAADHGQSAGLQTEPIPEPTGGDELILVIEDEAPLRRFICRVLTDLGYRVLEASHGEQALALAARHSDVRLVLTDVVMPGLSGRALEGQLRQAIPGLRVIFTSGYADEAIVHHGVLDEGTHYIQKPFTPAVLATKVRAVLDAPA